MGEIKAGLYVPSEEEAQNCIDGIKSCEYGICAECSVGYSETEEDNDNE